MKLLVTGGAGFIGSAVVRLAVSQGIDVINLDALTYAARLENLDSVVDAPNYTFVHADICNSDALARVFSKHQPDAVMHLAAETHVDRSIVGPRTFIDSNIVGTYVLLETARKNWGGGRYSTVRFHHVSTDEVYGTLGDTGSFREDSQYAPNSPYSASKAASDHLVRAWGHTYGLPYVITNCSNNYGPNQNPEKLTPSVILNALAGQPIPIYGTGENVRDWLYVEDHAAALLMVLKNGQTSRTYNIGGGNETRNIDLVQKICSILDRLRPCATRYSDLITFVSDRPGHDWRYAIDCTRICAELGWHPSVTLQEGLEETVRWYLDNQSWWCPIQNSGVTDTRVGIA